MTFDCVSDLWARWKRNGQAETWKINYLETKQLFDSLLNLCQNAGLDPQTFDFETIIDRGLSYYENLEKLKEAVGNPKTEEDQTELAKSETERLAQDLGLFDQYEKEIRRLKTETRNAETLKGKLTEAKAEIQTLKNQKPTETKIVFRDRPTREDLRNIFRPYVETFKTFKMRG